LFSYLSSSIGSSLPNSRAVLDGEIVCLYSDGYPQFNDLLFHRAEPCFMAFDILSCEERDLRFNALVDRKAELRRLLARRTASSRFAMQTTSNVTDVGCSN
jgi:ATP-dependent DNA ligase